ncbi:MAG: preprotein translocase subunit YajC [Clostridiales bacterium]|nr:preprotein translocase subunit YajC [Clostridiales bacterium]
MLELLNFFEDGGDGGNTGSGFPSWAMYVIFGVLIVGMVLLMIIPQRRQKKKAQEMMAQLAVGSIVTTIGGIVGEVVELDDKHIWLLTGTGDNKTTMQFVRQAIHSIAPAPGSPEAEAEAKAEREKADEVDEIK